MRNDAFLGVRINHELMGLISHRAEADDVTCSEFVRTILERELIGTSLKNAYGELLRKAKKDGNGKRKSTQNPPAVIRNSIRLIREFIRSAAAEPQLLDMHMVAIAEHLQHLQHAITKQEEEAKKLKSEMLELAQEVEWSSLMIQRIVRPEDYTGFNLDSEKQ